MPIPGVPLSVVSLDAYALDRPSLHDWAVKQASDRGCQFCSNLPTPFLYLRQGLEEYPIFVCSSCVSKHEELSKRPTRELEGMYWVDRAMGRPLGDSVDTIYAYCLQLSRSS